MSHEHDSHAAEHADAHAGNAAHGQHGAHPPHKKHKEHAHDAPPGTPPWLISFGDMMTLFLCFFIMLVTMAKTQDAGLMASGLGTLIASMEGSGSDGALTGSARLQAVNEYRQRFGLDPLTDAEMILGAPEVSSASDVEKLIKGSLRSYTEMRQPLLASFDPDSAALTDSARRYLDMLVDTLRPGVEQVLVLEGHADDAGASFANDNAWLAAARAQAVKQYLIEEHGVVATRVEARAWAIDLPSVGSVPRSVDGRLVQPAPKPQT